MKQVFLTFILSLLLQALIAQDTRVKLPNINRTYVKLNVLGLALRNYSFQLEHTIGKRVSLAMGYRMMPLGPIPLKKQVSDFVGSTASETNNTIDQLRAGNTSLTPELRCYIGKKGYGQGFYFAPFYRYSRFNAANVSVDYTTAGGGQSALNISGRVTSQAYGMLMGAQWRLGERIGLDWWIIGPHYGKAKGVLQGVPSIPLTANEQQSLRQEMENIEVPFTESRIAVTANSAKYILDGPWAGIRTGLALCFHF